MDEKVRREAEISKRNVIAHAPKWLLGEHDARILGSKRTGSMDMRRKEGGSGQHGVIARGPDKTGRSSRQAARP